MQPITFGTFGSDEMLSPNPQLASGGSAERKGGTEERVNDAVWPRSPRSPTVTTPSSEAPSFPAPYAI